TGNDGSGRCGSKPEPPCPHVGAPADAAAEQPATGNRQPATGNAGTGPCDSRPDPACPHVRAPADAAAEQPRPPRRPGPSQAPAPPHLTPRPAGAGGRARLGFPRPPAFAGPVRNPSTLRPTQTCACGGTCRRTLPARHAAARRPPRRRWELRAPAALTP